MNHWQKRTLYIISCLLLLMMNQGRCVFAQSGRAMVSCAINLTILPIGGWADLTIKIENTKNFYGYELTLNYDPAIVEILDSDPNRDQVNAELGDFIQQDFLQLNEINQPGELLLNLTQIAPTQAVSGDGVLATVKLQGKANGRVDFALTDIYLYDVNGAEIAYDVQGCSLQVAGASVSTPTPTATPTLTPTITETPSPTATPTVTEFPSLTSTDLPTPTATSSSTPTSVSTSTATEVVEPTATAFIENQVTPTLANETVVSEMQPVATETPFEEATATNTPTVETIMANQETTPATPSATATVEAPSSQPITNSVNSATNTPQAQPISPLSPSPAESLLPNDPPPATTQAGSIDPAFNPLVLTEKYIFLLIVVASLVVIISIGAFALLGTLMFSQLQADQRQENRERRQNIRSGRQMRSRAYSQNT